MPNWETGYQMSFHVHKNLIRQSLQNPALKLGESMRVAGAGLSSAGRGHAEETGSLLTLQSPVPCLPARRKQPQSPPSCHLPRHLALM